MARPLLTAAEMRALDAYTIEGLGVPGVALMETAGRAVAAAAERAIQGRGGGEGVGARSERPRVAILCGGGNNGGDGAVCGRTLLARTPYQVQLYLAVKRERVQGDALVHLLAYERAGGQVVDVSAAEGLGAELERIASADVLVDALLGTGLSAPVRGHFSDVLARVGAAARGTRVAVDIPSGLSADTGQPLGPVIRADLTVTFGQLKRGLACYPGVRLAGTVEVADIGLPATALEAAAHAAASAATVSPGEHGLSPVRVFLSEEQDLRERWPRRTRDAHKGTHGHLLVIGASPGLTGAALLAAQGALRAGVGKVSLGVPPEVLAQIEAQKPVEAMCRPLTARELAGPAAGTRGTSPGEPLPVLADIQAVALGPGIGRTAAAAQLLASALEQVRLPMVVDADGLWHLRDFLSLLKARQAPTVLTPHPGEMAHLVGTSTTAVQADRIEVARRFAREHQVTVVLKGAHSVVASADGEAHVVPFGNPGMATAGSGDVLAGIVGALLAGNLPAWTAALLGTWVHALAGDAARAELGEAALTAGDIARYLGPVLRAVETGRPLPV